MKRGKLAGIRREDLEPVWNRHDIPLSKVAARLGVSKNAISKLARRFGLPKRESVCRSLIDDDQMARMWICGVPARDIARHFGLTTPCAIYMRRKKLGLQPRGGRLPEHKITPLHVFLEREMLERMGERKK